MFVIVEKKSARVSIWYRRIAEKAQLKVLCWARLFLRLTQVSLQGLFQHDFRLNSVLFKEIQQLLEMDLIHETTEKRFIRCQQISSPVNKKKQQFKMNGQLQIFIIKILIACQCLPNISSSRFGGTNGALRIIFCRVLLSQCTNNSFLSPRAWHGFSIDWNCFDQFGFLSVKCSAGTQNFPSKSALKLTAKQHISTFLLYKFWSCLYTYCSGALTQPYQKQKRGV